MPRSISIHKGTYKILSLYLTKLLQDSNAIDDLINPMLYKKYEQSYLSKTSILSSTDKGLLQIEKEFEAMISSKTKELLKEYNLSKNII